MFENRIKQHAALQFGLRDKCVGMPHIISLWRKKKATKVKRERERERGGTFWIKSTMKIM